MKMRIISLIASTLVCAAPCQSQTTTSDDVLINGDNGTVNLKVTGNNGSLFTGTFGSGTIPATGAGTRMMWYPKKAAFRVGRVTSDQWDDAEIGEYSFAIGYNTVASGYASFATGAGQAGGNGATAFGESNATGEGAFSAGTFTYALASGSFAVGYENTAAGLYSSTFGGYNIANGYLSTVFGYFLQSYAYGSMVIGHYNMPDYSGDPDTYVSSDELFVIGNGSDWENLSNALIITKNANMRTAEKIEAKGGMRAKPLGDLSMGAFTTGDNPSTLDAGLKYSGE